MATGPFKAGDITGVIWRPLRRFDDPRGWLCEFFRHDEIPAEYHPVMGYISLSWPGVSRGPHEHADQADLFCFLGPSSFKLYLWDNRPGSATYWNRQIEVVGADRPTAVVVPPGVAHAYRNVGSEPGIVYNYPNQLYRGAGKRAPVDEIRHEDDPNTPFVLCE